ncbi:metal ABC transporter permease [Ammoniphilus sp. CFH 90114]|uniref:metal ABC transporter permease n=1 Tax=Ammoniphilus sp. CFH 90114 TaxID=2493665 RepID=UPI00100F0217|nr:metal ABC transporter permease [Ammoniphilus sp. CFH 90114]RXT13542.1 metal ABC transporter permease [Ammoniphilus sp. CFH 90114]
MLEIIFQYEFMRNALFAGLIVGIICPAIGVFLVVRRLSLMADALSHITLAGIAAGILLGKKVAFFQGLNPMYMGMVFSVVGSLLVEQLRKAYRFYQELAIPIILSTGIGLGVVLISIAKGFNVDLFSYLFGSVVAVGRTDLWAIIGIGLAVLLSLYLLYKELFALSFDEEYARISGIRRSLVNLIFTILVALTIAISMRIVGILLVSALITLPVAAALQISHSFKQTLWMSIIFAEIAVLGGLTLAFYLDWASGGTIVLFSVFMLLSVLLVKKLILKAD